MNNTNSQIARNAQASPSARQTELMAAGHGLGSAMDHYANLESGGQEESANATRSLISAVADWFDAMLPAAGGDIKKALVELCVMETARARLESDADAGKLGSARILSATLSKQ